MTLPNWLHWLLTVVTAAIAGVLAQTDLSDDVQTVLSIALVVLAAAGFAPVKNAAPRTLTTTQRVSTRPRRVDPPE